MPGINITVVNPDGTRKEVEKREFDETNPPSHFSGNDENTFGFAQAHSTIGKTRQRSKYDISKTELNRLPEKKQEEILQQAYQQISKKITSNPDYDGRGSTITYVRADLIKDGEKTKAKIVAAHAGNAYVSAITKDKETGQWVLKDILIGTPQFDRDVDHTKIPDGYISGSSFYTIANNKRIRITRYLSPNYHNVILQTEQEASAQDPTNKDFAPTGGWEYGDLNLTHGLGGNLALKDPLFTPGLTNTTYEMELQGGQPFYLLVTSKEIYDIWNKLSDEGKNRILENTLKPDNHASSAYDFMAAIKKIREETQIAFENVLSQTHITDDMVATLKKRLIDLGLKENLIPNYKPEDLDYEKRRAKAYSLRFTNTLLGPEENQNIGILPLNTNAKSEENQDALNSNVLTSTSEMVMTTAVDYPSIALAQEAQTLFLPTVEEIVQAAEVDLSISETASSTANSTLGTNTNIPNTSHINHGQSTAIPQSEDIQQEQRPHDATLAYFNADDQEIPSVNNELKNFQQNHLMYTACTADGRSGLVQDYGERTTQEDRCRVSSGPINKDDATNLTKKELIQKAVFLYMNEQSKKELIAKEENPIPNYVPGGGSTLAYVSATTVVEEGKKVVYVTTAHAGDSPICLVTHDINETKLQPLTKPHIAKLSDFEQTGNYYHDVNEDDANKPEVNTYFRKYVISSPIPANENDIQPYHVYVEKLPDGSLQYKVKNNETSQIYAESITKDNNPYKDIKLNLDPTDSFDIDNFTATDGNELLRFMRRKGHIEKAVFTYNTYTQQCHLGGLEVTQTVADFDLKHAGLKREVHVEHFTIPLMENQKVYAAVFSDGASLPGEKNEEVLREGLNAGKPLHLVVKGLITEKERQHCIIQDVLAKAEAEGKDDQERKSIFLAKLKEHAVPDKLDINEDRLKVLGTLVDNPMPFDEFAQIAQPSFIIACGSDNSTALMSEIEYEPGTEIKMGVYDGHKGFVVSQVLQDQHIPRIEFLEKYLTNNPATSITEERLVDILRLHQSILNLAETSLANPENSALKLLEKFFLEKLEQYKGILSEESIPSLAANKSTLNFIFKKLESDKTGSNINKIYDLANSIKIETNKSLAETCRSNQPDIDDLLVDLNVDVRTEEGKSCSYAQYGLFHIFKSEDKDDNIFHLLEITRLQKILGQLDLQDEKRENLIKLIKHLTEAWEYVNKTPEGKEAQPHKQKVLREMLNDVLDATSRNILLDSSDRAHKRLECGPYNTKELSDKLTEHYNQLQGQRHWRWAILDIAVCLTGVGALVQLGLHAFKNRLIFSDRETKSSKMAMKIHEAMLEEKPKRDLDLAPKAGHKLK